MSSRLVSCCDFFGRDVPFAGWAVYCYLVQWRSTTSTIWTITTTEHMHQYTQQHPLFFTHWAAFYTVAKRNIKISPEHSFSTFNLTFYTYTTHPSKNKINNDKKKCYLQTHLYLSMTANSYQQSYLCHCESFRGQKIYLLAKRCPSATERLVLHHHKYILFLSLPISLLPLLLLNKPYKEKNNYYHLIASFRLFCCTFMLCTRKTVVVLSNCIIIYRCRFFYGFPFLMMLSILNDYFWLFDYIPLCILCINWYLFFLFFYSLMCMVASQFHCPL